MATPFKAPCYTDTDVSPWEVTSATVRTCLRPQRANPQDRVVFLLGDSHAAMLQPAIEQLIAGRRGVSLTWTGITGWHCGFMANAQDVEARCEGLVTIMWDTIQQNVQQGDVVIVSHASYKYDPRQNGFLRRFYTDVLAPKGAKLLLMGNPPELPTFAIYCLTNQAPCIVHSTANADKSRFLQPLAADVDGIFYFELWNLFCTEWQCGPTVPGTGTFAYFDMGHLTHSGALYLVPYLCSFFDLSGLLT